MLRAITKHSVLISFMLGVCTVLIVFFSIEILSNQQPVEITKSPSETVHPEIDADAFYAF